MRDVANKIEQQLQQGTYGKGPRSTTKLVESGLDYDKGSLNVCQP